MLSQYTWPNYRGTSDKEAVLVLLRDLAVTDFQAGHTKLFIRGTSDKEAVLVLLRDLAVTDFQAGHTKLFIR
ncbi:unnamed protein product [Plutella xylostella]|uniref:(diamondback moth) hypothetical protein n=1 Tax=Plutella xylostella TaxID=51655 RepID=A0A8S4FET8_PLUXY|nr:unnamed protein product [Plutella xylostella]